MGLRRADGRDDAFADACDDGLFAGAADEAIDVGAHGDAAQSDELDAVFRDRGDFGRRNDFRIDAHLNGFEHVTSGEIDRSGLRERELDVGFVGGDEGVHDALDVATREVVRFELIHAQFETGFDGADARFDDHRWRHAAQPHRDECADADIGAGRKSRNPEPERHEVQDESHADENQQSKGRKSH